MGSWCSILVESAAADLARRDDVTLLSPVVCTIPDCGWVAFDGPVLEPEDTLIDETGAVIRTDAAFEACARLSKALDRRVCITLGHTVTDWVQYVLFEAGDCVRALDATQEGWTVIGEAAQPWERELIDGFFAHGDGEMIDEAIASSEANARVEETRALQHGATIPTMGQSDLERAHGFGVLLYLGGERVRVRAKKGLLARLFGW